MKTFRCILWAAIVSAQLFSMNLYAALEGASYTTPADAPLLTAPTTSIQLHVYDSRVWKFIPTSTAVYTIETVGADDSYGRLFGSTDLRDEMILAQGDDEVGLNLRMSYLVTAGQTYYIVIYEYFAESVCDLQITGGTLPVELTSFSAAAAERTITLAWKTATEVNNYGFDVERRSMGAADAAGNSVPGTWSRIGFVEGHGTTNAPQSYSFRDHTACERVAYRLKQIDRDGAHEYSKEIEITAAAAPGVCALAQNYPNPFNPATTISFTVPMTGRATLTIFDALGQEVAVLFNDEAKGGIRHEVPFDASGLASGIYFSRLQYAGTVKLNKMALTK